MVMSSHEVVRCAIEFEVPDRLPLRFAMFGLNDTHWVRWNQLGPGGGDLSQRETYDEWHCLWQRTEQANMGQVKGHPLADWGNLDHYQWPDPGNPAFYQGMEERFVGSDGKYVMTDLHFFLFERMHMLRGFENTLLDLYLEREKTEMLADRIVEFDLGVIENLGRRFGRDIHGFWFTDDWGTEQALFINPQLWQEFFKPRYRRLVDAIHSAGWHAWMHSCGKVNDIIGGLLEIGLDVINLQQPRALGIEQIGQQFRGRICFESLCDIQHTLPFKGEKEIREEAQLLLENWATPEGGFILSDYGDGRAIGVEPEKKRLMLDAFRQVDPWERRS